MILETNENINLLAPTLYSLIVLLSFDTSRGRTKKKLSVLLIITSLVMATLMFSLPSTVSALNVATSSIRATDVWAMGNAGYDVRVAVIDDGIDLAGDDFDGAIVDAINIHDPIYGSVFDTTGHGTYVAGIIAGRGVGINAYKGVAWEAKLVIVKIEDAADMEHAVRWIIDNRALYNIKVISSSMGPGNVPYGGDGLDSPYAKALDDAVEASIVVVQAAGNNGHKGSGTIESPGAAFNVITVGAVNDQNTPDINDDEIYYHPTSYEYKGATYPPQGSARGLTGDGRPKPDVVTPGEHIWSTGSFEHRFYYEDRQYVGMETYGELSGTSAAAPMVAGTVALMLRANPNLTPTQVKAILRQTARLNTNLNGLTVNDRGHGIIDAYAAVQLAQNISNINRNQMYDSWEVTTPSRFTSPFGSSGDWLEFTVDAPSSIYGISLSDVHVYWWEYFTYYYDCRLFSRMSAQHIWIDGTYYHLGNDMNKYLFSGPRITEKDAGYALMRALYRVNNVIVKYDWKMYVDEIWLS